MKKNLRYIAFIGVFIIGIVLLFLPSDYFDQGQSICLSVVLFKKECYGCGMTRAIQHLIHLDIEKAYSFNKLSVVVLPLIIFMLFYEFRKLRKEKK